MTLGVIGVVTGRVAEEPDEVRPEQEDFEGTQKLMSRNVQIRIKFIQLLKYKILIYAI